MTIINGPLKQKKLTYLSKRRERELKISALRVCYTLRTTGNLTERKFQIMSEIRFIAGISSNFNHTYERLSKFLH